MRLPQLVRNAVTVVAVLITAGCRFDASVPDGVVLTCEENSNCPDGFACSKSLGACVRLDASDREAPRVLSVQFSKPLLTRGDTLTVSFTVSEPLVLPTVVASEPGTSRALTLVESGEGAEPRYTFSLALGADDVEGNVSILANLFDRVGNENRNVVLGSVAFDFTPPEVRTLDFIAPRHVDVGAVPVRSDETVQVRVLVSEPVQDDGLHLVASAMGCDGGVVEYELINNRSGLLDFRRGSPAGQLGCEFGFTLGGVRDLAGNATSPQPVALSSTYRIDDTAPLLEGLSAFSVVDGGWSPATLFSRQVGFDVMGVSFRLEPDAQNVRVSLDDATLSCDLSACSPAANGLRACRCVRPLGANDVEGAHVVQVTAQDVAGNGQFISIPVRFDFTAPQLSATNAYPSLSKSGDQLVYTVTASEPLTTAPTLTVNGGGTLPFALVPGSSYAFSHLVASPDVDGTYVVEVSMTDAVGNTATALAGAPFSIDVTPPVISNLTTDAATYSAQSGHDVVTATFAVSGAVDASSVVARLGTGVMACTSAGTSWTCTATVTGNPGEDGVRPLTVSLRDPAGNAANASTAVFVDFTPPTFLAGTVNVTLVPAPTNRFVPAITGLSIGASARLSFTASEPLGIDPTVVTTNPGLYTFSKTSGFATVFVYSLTVAGTPPQGAYDVAVTLVDPVGNSAVVTVPAPFVVDVDGPSVLSPSQLAGVVFQRSPWGSNQTNGVVDFRMLATDAGVFEPNATVVVLDGPTPATASELGRARASATGAMAALPLQTADRGAVWLVQVDGAGNLDVPTATKVTQVEWVATLGGKVAGSTAENPHRFVSRGVMDSRLTVLLGDRWGNREEGGAELKRVDGNAVQTSARGTLRQIAPRVLLPGRAFASMAYDSFRDRLVHYGGGRFPLSAGNRETREWEAPGTWRTLTLPDLDLSGGPPATFQTSLVFDSARGVTVLFAGGFIWEYDGISWKRVVVSSTTLPADDLFVLAFDSARRKTVAYHQGGVFEWDGVALRGVPLRDPERDGNPAGDLPVMAFDAVRQCVVLIGATGSFATWEYDGQSWRKVVLGDPEGDGNPPSVRPAGMTWDGARSRIVTFWPNGETWEYDGVSWRKVIATDPEGDGNPAGRVWAAMAWDSFRQRVVLYGGYQPSLFNDTWTWNGSSWARLDSVLSGAPDVAMAFYDATFGEVALVDTGFNLSTWNGARWTAHPVTGRPPARSAYAINFHPVWRQVLMFGGVNPDFAGYEVPRADLWRLDLSASTWTNITPAGAGPSARGYAGIAATDNNSMVLFGGAPGLYSTESQHPTDGWEFVGGHWQQLLGTMPSIRESPGMVSGLVGNPGAEYVWGPYVFAGSLTDPYNLATTRNDIWSFTGDGWYDLTPTSGELPPPASSPGLTMGPGDAQQVNWAVVYAMGGNPMGGTTGCTSQIWKFPVSDEAWRRENPIRPRDEAPPCAAPRLTWDFSRRALVIFSGGQVWEEQFAPTERSGQVFSVALGAAGIPVGASLRSATAAFVSGASGQNQTAGVRLQAWVGEGWRTLNSSTAPLDTPALVSSTVTDATSLAQMSATNSLHFAVMSEQPNGPGLDLSTVSTDYAEVRVRYQLP